MTQQRPASSHRETHHLGRSGWLRAAVLGSNDAIVSTASLMIGVAASSAPRSAILVSGNAPRLRAAVRVTVGDVVAMGLSAAIGRLLGVSVS